MNTWHEPSITRHVLSLQVFRRATDPIRALNGLVGESKLLINGILGRGLDQIIVLLEVWLRDGDVEILIARLLALISD